MESPACASEVRNDGILESSLLGLPEQIRVRLLQEYVNLEDRLVLRTVSPKLRHDIDEFLGPSNLLILNDEVSDDILEFYSRTFFPNIEIRKWCIPGGFQNVPYKPESIKSLTLKRSDLGMVSASFLEGLLQTSQGLTFLNLNGLIQGEIPRNGREISLPYLKKFQLLLSDNLNQIALPAMPIVNGERVQPDPAFIQNAVYMWKETQQALLIRLKAPLLEELVLSMNYRPNSAKEDFDDIEVTQLVCDFVKRHPNFKRLKILSRVFAEHYRFLTGYRRSVVPPSFDHSHYYTRAQILNPATSVQGPTVMQYPQFEGGRIKEFTYLSQFDTEQPLENNLLEFMESLEGLEKLNLSFPSGDRDIDWDLLLNMIQKNGPTLTEIVVSNALRLGIIRTDLVLDIFGICPSLKTLWIYYLNAFADNLPIQLTPSVSTINNLTTLILNGYHGITVESLQAIPLLVNLRYLCLMGIGSEIPDEISWKILRMRSLEGVIIPLISFRDPETGFIEFSQELITCRDLDAFITDIFYSNSCYRKVFNISDPVTPWWTKLQELGKFEFQEPGKLPNVDNNNYGRSF